MFGNFHTSVTYVSILCSMASADPIFALYLAAFWRWDFLQLEVNSEYRHMTLQWRHNKRDGVSNHQPHDCLLNRLFRHRSKKTTKLRITGLCEGNSPVTGEFPAQRANNAEIVSIWWRHHETNSTLHDATFLWTVLSAVLSSTMISSSITLKSFVPGCGARYH